MPWLAVCALVQYGNCFFFKAREREERTLRRQQRRAEIDAKRGKVSKEKKPTEKTEELIERSPQITPEKAAAVETKVEKIEESPKPKSTPKPKRKPKPKASVIPKKTKEELKQEIREQKVTRTFIF